MKKPILIILVLLIVVKCLSQETSNTKISKNIFLAEFCINQDLDLYSILYDRLLKANGTLNIGLQTGLSFSTAIETGDKGYSMFYPIKGYFSLGRSAHKFESKLGVRILGYVFPDFNVGYRYKPFDNGLCFRVGYIGLFLPGGLNNMLSLSIGYTF